MSGPRRGWLAMAAQEAGAIARGEKPAAAVWFDGHRYVPADALTALQAEIARLRAGTISTFDHTAKLMELRSLNATLAGDVAALQAETARLQAQVEALKGALAWYRGNVSWCNSYGPEGVEARDRLAKDGGARAEAALAALDSNPAGVDRTQEDRRADVHDALTAYGEKRDA